MIAFPCGLPEDKVSALPFQEGGDKGDPVNLNEGDLGLCPEPDYRLHKAHRPHAAPLFMTHTNSALAFVFLLLTLFPSLALAAQTLNLGMFAYRPKPVLAARYQALVDYINKEVPEVNIQLFILNQDEMEQALANNTLDLIFTNPSHFIQLRHQNQLSGAIATLVSQEDGVPSSALGGVIAAPADRDEIQELADLRGKHLLVPGTRFLGGYQAQAYELLKHGIKLPGDAQLETLNGHDAVIRALLNGHGDAGFVRTGILESMTAAGLIPPGRLKVINLQNMPGFPFQVSTQLYPEWAFAALPHVNEAVVRRIAVALFRIEPNNPAAKTAGINGFTIPADYLPVENAARALRLPPFENMPNFTPTDVWTRYQWPLLVALALALVILLMGVRQSLLNRRLKQTLIELERLATTDTLTDLPNRRHFLQYLHDTLRRIQRFEGPAALLMLDLDHFKRINDQYGHAAGDAVLQAFARTIQQALRQTDLAGRLGGEEFAILLPASQESAARTFAERLRERVAKLRIVHGPDTIRITVSIGISFLMPADAQAEAALARADAALYQAKTEGRNRIAVKLADATSSTAHDTA